MIEGMEAAGAEPEMILATIKAMLGNRSSAAVRQARYRENNRNSNVTLRNEHNVTHEPLSPLAPLDKETSPRPPKEIKPPYTPQTRSRAFEEFWMIYPNKVGKPKAETAYSKAILRSDERTIMAGLERYVTKTDDRQWCNPATWLNQDRWTDVPAIVARGPPSKGPTLSERFAQLGQFASERQNGNGLETSQQALRLVPPSPTDE